MDLTAKRKRNGLRMKHQDSASSVSRSFSLSSDFPSVACFRCRMPYERMVGRGKIFGQNTLRRRKILPETALPPDLAFAIKPCATFASEHRERASDGMNSIIPSGASSATRNKKRHRSTSHRCIQFTNYKLSKQNTLFTAYPERNGYNHF